MTEDILIEPLSGMTEHAGLAGLSSVGRMPPIKYGVTINTPFDIVGFVLFITISHGIIVCIQYIQMSRVCPLNP